MRSRPATESDLDDVTATLTAAFAGDPVWRWAFADLAELEALWRFLLRSALRYPWVRMLDGATAVALWIPPGGTELEADEEAQLEAQFDARVLELFGRFEQAHPDSPPHYYLSLLGTRPDQRGQGLGMALLSECLELFDAEGVPTYLESSNPANDARYERLGYRRVGSFSTPDGAHTLATMWREPVIG
jgi:ribosomal protein S18 acetylase RimI-like enzyme